MSQKLVLHRLHQRKERRKVHDAGGVRIAEFNATSGGEGGHNAEGRRQKAEANIRFRVLQFAFCLSGHSPTYGNSAINLARLMASVTACWLAAVQPLLRRLTILP